MKSAYFTEQTIHDVSADFAQRVAEIRQHRVDFYTRGKAALLVLDMQRYFLETSSHAYIPSAESIVPNLQALIRVFTQYGRPILFTRHLNTAQDAGNMATWWRDLIRREDPLSEIDARLEARGRQVIEKAQYDAFLNTGLDAALRAQGVEQVVITGVMTHLCCETTARSAFMRGYDVFFAIDGTATYNADFHWASLQNLAHGFAVPVLTREILDGMEGSHD